MTFDIFFAGTMSGISQCLIGHPFDTLKVWRQNGLTPQSGSLLSKVDNLFKGIAGPLIQTPIGVAISFTCNESLLKKYNNIYISSVGTGILSAIITTPIDYYKVRKQQHIPFYLANCYKNIHAVAMREIPSNTIYFSTYRHIKQHLSSKEETYSQTAITMISGGMAGFSSWFFTYPLDTIKTRLQANTAKSINHAISQGNLFNGLPVCCTRAVIVNAIGFQVYESSLQYCSSNNTHNL